MGESIGPVRATSQQRIEYGVEVTLNTNVKCCARCGGDHGRLKFLALTHPCADLTHWCLCPTNGEPILMKIIPDEVAHV